MRRGEQHYNILQVLQQRRVSAAQGGGWVRLVFVTASLGLHPWSLIGGKRAEID